MTDIGVTRQELRDEVNAAEGRGQDMVTVVAEHFDQRLKDTERVLTWRMIATAGVGSVLTAFVGASVKQSERATDAVGAILSLFT